MTIPKYFDDIVELLEDAAEGANKYGAAVGLKQNTEPTIRVVLVALVGTPAGPNNVPPAVPGLQALWNTAKAKIPTTTAACHVAIKAGRALTMACVDTLRPALGRSWNSAWNAVGFTAGSLAVPDNPAALLLTMRAYYAANPAREVKSINGIDCTADACQAASDAIIAAQTAMNNADESAATAQTNLQDGIDDARTVLSGLQSELGQLLEDNDPRWLSFGFDLPGHTASPDVPQNLTVTPGAAGSHLLLAKCDDSSRADGYRFTVTNPADDSKLFEDLTQDAEDTISSLTSGTTVKVVVTARNATGESQPSAPVTVVVP